MKKITALPAPKSQRPRQYRWVLLYVVVVVVVTTYILYKFDHLTLAIAQYGIGGGRAGMIVAVSTVCAGVFALPYLLRMTVSPLMRIVSWIATYVAPLGWLLGAWWLEINTVGVPTVLAVTGAHVAVGLALLSSWIIGLPFKPLKKRR